MKGDDTFVPFKSGVDESTKFVWFSTVSGVNGGEADFSYPDAFGSISVNQSAQSSQHQTLLSTNELEIYLTPDNYKMPFCVYAKKDITITTGVYYTGNGQSGKIVNSYNAARTYPGVVTKETSISAGNTEIIYTGTNSGTSLGRYMGGFIWLECGTVPAPTSNLIKGAVFCGKMDTRSAPSGFDDRRWFVFNTDGTCYRTSDYENIGQYSDLITYKTFSSEAAIFTVKKAGYYINNGTSITDIGQSARISYLNVGDQICTVVSYTSSSPFCVYLGETNPFA